MLQIEQRKPVRHLGTPQIRIRILCEREEQVHVTQANRLPILLVELLFRECANHLQHREAHLVALLLGGYERSLQELLQMLQRLRLVADSLGGLERPTAAKYR